MDPMSLLNSPLGGWAGGGGYPLPMNPGLANARLAGCPLHPMQPSLLAGDAATQRLLLQAALVLLSLMANSAPQNGGGANSSGGGGGSDASGASPVGAATGNQVERPGGKIDSSIAGNFDAMVAAAKREGVDLQIGSGWRSRQQQEVLYRKYLNGTGNLAARPGTSNHESGRAIDFKNTPGAFAWLKKNAQRFGFKNLPGEPWHYSVNGQ